MRMCFRRSLQNVCVVYFKGNEMCFVKESCITSTHSAGSAALHTEHFNFPMHSAVGFCLYCFSLSAYHYPPTFLCYHVGRYHCKPNFFVACRVINVASRILCCELAIVVAGQVVPLYFDLLSPAFGFNHCTPSIIVLGWLLIVTCRFFLLLPCLSISQLILACCISQLIATRCISQHIAACSWCVQRYAETCLCCLCCQSMLRVSACYCMLRIAIYRRMLYISAYLRILHISAYQCMSHLSIFSPYAVTYLR